MDSDLFSTASSFFSANQNVLPWAIAVTVGIIGIFIVRVYLRAAVARKVRSIQDSPAMSMMDIDQMRKKGLVSETEYKAIRHTLAERELEKNRRRQQTERERAILAEVERDPEAARQLLVTPDAQAAPDPVHPAAAPAAPGKPAAAPVKEGARAGDLDVLLQKGAITPEEYQRLKAFFK